MTTKPAAKKTKRITVKLNRKLADDLGRRADSMNISTSKYCMIIFHQWLESGRDPGPHAGG